LQQSSVICEENYSVFLRYCNQNFETRLSLAGRLGTWSTRGWNQAGMKKKREKEKPDVTWWPDWPDQNLVAYPLTFVCFVFLLKRRRFDYFLKNNWSDRPGDLVKTLELGLWTGSGLKTMIITVIFNQLNIKK